MTTGTLVTGGANGDIAPEDAGQGSGELDSGASTTAATDTGEQTTGGEGSDTLAGGESTTAGGEGADSVAGQEGADSVAGAPDEYADFQVPDGVTVDAGIAGDFKTLAKELNLPQDAAQKVFDLGIAMSQKWADGHSQALTDMREGWVDAVKADPELGGSKLNENVAAAQKAIATFGSDELKELLDTSGLGNHPAIFRFAAAVGKGLGEDDIVTGGHSGAQPRDSRQFYPNSPELQP